MKTNEFIPWKKKFETRVEIIDEQHKKLVGLINLLYDSYMQKKHKEVISDVVAELVDYTVYHFETEEQYFKQFNYENTEAHVKEHQNFTNEVNNFQKKFGENEGVLTTEVLLFLQQWITKHISISDMKYVECFEDNGLIS